MCKILRGTEIFEGDARSRLESQLNILLGKNRTLMVGPEPEFFLINDNKPADSGTYCDTFPSSAYSGLIKRFTLNLNSIGIIPSVHHHEVAEGQYEIEIGHSDALSIADKIVNFKSLIKALAVRNGLKATFMPKPFKNINGNGMHCHLSIWEDNKNLFSAGTVTEISDIAKNFMAGLLEHAKSLTAIVAPTVNSYKRLIPGFETPVYISWAPRNRSALIRIPLFKRPEHARIEYRCPDPSSNSYLSLIAILAAGMDGVNNNLELIDPVKRNIYHMTPKERKDLNIEPLPGSLSNALEFLKQDKILRKALGEYIFNQFIEHKEAEIHDYSRQITDWDWKNYFDV